MQLMLFTRSQENVELLIDNFRMTRNDFDAKVVHFGLYVDGGIC